MLLDSIKIQNRINHIQKLNDASPPAEVLINNTKHKLEKVLTNHPGWVSLYLARMVVANRPLYTEEITGRGADHNLRKERMTYLMNAGFVQQTQGDLKTKGSKCKFAISV